MGFCAGVRLVGYKWVFVQKRNENNEIMRYKDACGIIILLKGYKNDSICPCIFMKRFGNEFAIITIYVDNINIIRTPKELPKVINCLKKEFETKNLGKTKICLGLQVDYLRSEILCIKKLVKQRFYMDKSHPLCTSMIVRSLEVNKDPSKPREKDEKLFGPEIPFLSAIGALMCLANYT
ncbi:hypothetical protein CR513_57991, partial [Mucuna pruriens]